MIDFRKCLVMMLILVTALGVAGCGGSDDDGDDDRVTTTATDRDTETDTEGGGEGEGETETASADGEEIFRSNCSVCHGFTGAGGNGGPAITESDDVPAITEQVLKGGGGMPAFEGQLTEEDATAVAEYVASL